MDIGKNGQHIGRWKLGPQGAYYDPNDTGPDQVAPPAPQTVDYGQNAAGHTQAGPHVGPVTREGIAQAYRTSLGREPGEHEYDAWLGNANYPNEIASSPEALAYGSGQAYTPPPVPRPSYAPMAGVDVNKLNDPAHVSEKYTAARILASGGDIHAAAAAIGATVVSQDKMRLRSGEIIDIYEDVEGARRLQWTPMGGQPGDPGNVSAIVAQGGGQFSPAGGSPVSAGGGQASVPGTPDNTLVKQLLSRITNEPAANANNPAIRGAVNAYNATETRQMRKYLSELAERKGANELIQPETRSVNERVGQDTAQYEAQYLLADLNRQYMEATSALESLRGYLSQQDALKLQERIQQLQNAIAWAGLQQNAYQFDVNDEFRRSPLAS